MSWLRMSALAVHVMSAQQSEHRASRYGSQPSQHRQHTDERSCVTCDRRFSSPGTSDAAL